MGAVGSAVGTGVGVLIALAFMLMIYHMNRKIIRRRIERDRSRDLLETGEIFKIILFMVTPVLLSTFAYNASALINQTLYLNLMQSVHNASYDDITIINGIYDTEAVGLSNIPIAIASAMASAILPSIAGSFETKKKKDVRHKISVAIKTIMFIAIPSAVGMTVLSRPIVWLLYNTNTDSIRLGGCLLAALGASIVFYSLSTLSNSILQSRQGVEAGYKRGDCAGGADCGGGSPPDLYRYWYLQFADRRYGIFFYDVPVKWHRGEKATGYHQEIEKTFVLPLVSSAIMGLVVAGIYYGLTLTVLKGYLGNAVALLLSVAIGGLTYFAAALKLGVMSKKELLGIPGGSMIVKFAVKLHLLKN